MNSTTNAILNYECIQCGYSTPKKWVYDTHLKSKKHLAMQTAETANVFQHACTKCSKKYKTICGLRRHRVLCNSSEDKKLEKEKEKKQEDLINKLFEEVNKLKSQMALQLMKDDCAMITEGTSNSHNNIVDIANSAITNNSNSHNVTYRDINNNTSIHQNVHVYLNTHCHETPSINEFIDKIQFSKAEIDQIVRAHQGEQIHKALIRVFKSKLQDVPFQQRPLHCVKPPESTTPGESSLFVMDDQEWKEENTRKTAMQIRDVEVYDDDSDAEYQLPEEKTGEIKTPLNKATAKFTRKMHDVCEELYSDKDEQSKAENVMMKMRKCSTIGDLVESLEKMPEIALDPSQIDPEA